MDAFWLALGAVQVGFSAYVLAALLTWRGERLWPAAGAPLATGPALLAAALFVALLLTMVNVADAEFSRYLGSGSLMLVATGVFVSALRRSRRG